MAEPSAAQTPVQGVAGQRPERQLDDIMVKFGGGVAEIMQAIDNQHRDQGAERPGQRPGCDINDRQS